MAASHPAGRGPRPRHLARACCEDEPLATGRIARRHPPAARAGTARCRAEFPCAGFGGGGGMDRRRRGRRALVGLALLALALAPLGSPAAAVTDACLDRSD